MNYKLVVEIKNGEASFIFTAIDDSGEVPVQTVSDVRSGLSMEEAIAASREALNHVEQN